MIEELRQRLQALERPPGLEDEPGVVPFGIGPIDQALGGGLARGALHEIAAAGEAHVPTAAGFAAAVAKLSVIPERPPQPFGLRWPLSESIAPSTAAYGFRARDLTVVPRNDEEWKASRTAVWVAEDMALAESGALHGPGLVDIGLAPERLVTVAAGHRRDLMWAMEEALRCRSVGAVIGEMRGGALDSVAVRRLSLAAAESGALAVLLRAAPEGDASTAATRWIVNAAPSAPTLYGLGAPCFAAQLTRNRRGPAGTWIIEWSESDARFSLAAHAQPVAQPVPHRPHRKIA